jgi:2-keto-4-pentenoate hydratase/2-oxohepta-3-ene-1,7-dioic acid hydratase in catechol pathway
VGDGSGLEQLRFLEPGDVVELEVEGIGVLRNRVVKP